MKIQTNLMLLAMIASFAMVSCDKLDVEFDADYKTTLNVVTEKGFVKSTDGAFYESATIDPLSNSDMAKYAKKIKSIEVREVKGVIKSINEPTLLETCLLKMSSPGSTSAEWTYTNKQLDVGTEFIMDNSNGQLDNMEQILDKKEEFTVEMSGSTSGDNVSFSLEVTIKTKVTANPL